MKYECESSSDFDVYKFVVLCVEQILPSYPQMRVLYDLMCLKLSRDLNFNVFGFMVACYFYDLSWNGFGCCGLLGFNVRGFLGECLVFILDVVSRFRTI